MCFTKTGSRPVGVIQLTILSINYLLKVEFFKYSFFSTTCSPVRCLKLFYPYPTNIRKLPDPEPTNIRTHSNQYSTNIRTLPDLDPTHSYSTGSGPNKCLNSTGSGLDQYPNSTGSGSNRYPKPTGSGSEPPKRGIRRRG